MKRDTVIDEALARAQSDSDDEQYYNYLRDDSPQEQIQDTDHQPEPEPDPEPKLAGRPSKIKEAIVSVLSGNILSHAEVKRQYPYMLFLAFLTLLYISNVFKMQQLHRQHDNLAREVKELRAKSLTISSQRVDATRQSQIIKELEARGLALKESLSPPKVISE